MVGLNRAPSENGAPQVGDGSGHKYTQAQIDHVLGGDKVAPAGASVGTHNGHTYTQAQISARDAVNTNPPTKADALVAKP